MAEKVSAFPYWSRKVDEVAAALDCGLTGLTSAGAAAALRAYGPNTIQDVSRLSALRLLLRQFESPLVLILVFAASISLMLRQWMDASIILGIVIGSALLGFFQEYRASTAVEELKRRLELFVRVRRDGAEKSVPVRDIVPGDLILLSAGNLIPADGLVVEAQDFLVSEASMTGETFPVEKRPGVVAADAPLAARTNAVFLGASVRSGAAKILAVRTGANTEFGAIAETLKSRAPETDFTRGVRQFGYLLVRVMLVIVISVLTVNVAIGRPPIESLLFSVALAVGLTPELLPAIIAVTLSAGARELSARGVIVRRLEAMENLGSMNVLCTDKTGTLTEGVIELQEALDSQARGSTEILRLAFLNAFFESGIENPLDEAIVSSGQSYGLSSCGLSKVDEIPYDFIRRRLTIVIADDRVPSPHLMIAKGAVAQILEICSFVEWDGVDVALDETRRASLQQIFESRSAQGCRVLAVATRQLAAQARYLREDEVNLTFRGFLILIDPPKRDIVRTIADLNDLGVRIKVISGDNRYVTAHLAQTIGLDSRSMLTGAQLHRMRDESLWHLAPRTDLFVEIDPQQKERIVRALQHTGRVVGYLGDGINDAPALHAADVGVSVEKAVDVARESADIILLRTDLDVLREGVEGGRRTFINTLKYIQIAASANFGNMISMALATPFLPFLPLAAKQILLNNFLSSIPSVALSTDNVDAEQVARPQKWSIKGIRSFMIVFGLVSSVFDLLTFGVLLYVFRAGEALFQTSWFMISLLTELVVVLVLRTHRPALLSQPSDVLLGATIVVSVLTFAIPVLGAVSAAFNFVPLPMSLLTSVVAIVLGYVVATELVKIWFFRARL